MVDAKTVQSFGHEWHEWSTYAQHCFADDEASSARRFDEYFAIFPWEGLPEEPVGADVGCGSGRWALRVVLWVGTLHCIDASAEAREGARQNLAGERAEQRRQHSLSVLAAIISPTAR
jgi:hypothetical protein